MDDNRILTSYDVTALLTSVPVKGAIEVVTDLLKKDSSWNSRTYLNEAQIISLLEICPTTTCFKFRGQINQQDHGCAMGLPISLFIANLYMESFEVKAITSAASSHRVWMRCLDGHLYTAKLLM